MNIRTRTAAALALAALLATAAAGEDFSVGLGLSGSADSEAYEPIYTTERFALDYSNGPFQAFGAFAMTGDGKYGTTAADGYMEGLAVAMEESGLRFQNDFFLAEAGRLQPTDIVASPYSLFVSDQANSSLGARYTISGESVSMTTRWLSLTERSESGYPDRGAVLKTYSLKLGKLLLAYQDAAIYTTSIYESGAWIEDLRVSNFDPEYFFNPLPAWFIQYLNSRGDNPRSMKQDDNALMGLYAEWRDDDFSAYIQFLVDDINLNRFFKPSSFMIPDKLAFSLGGTLGTELGLFGLYVGGATKYAFESTGGNDKDNLYGYTYVPDVSYSSGGEARPILMEDNMIGFKLGENALGLKGTWAKEFGELAASAGLELTLKGEQSPANSWHGADSAPNDTAFLDDALLETKLVASMGASWKRDALRLSLSGRAGYAWNPMALVAAPDAALPAPLGLPLLKPQAGGAAILALTVGVSYDLDVLALARPR